MMYKILNILGRSKLIVTHDIWLLQRAYNVLFNNNML